MPLTQTLNETQLKQNIDALIKANKSRQDVQAYVDNYTKDETGNYILKGSQTVEPVKQSNPVAPEQTAAARVLTEGIPAIPAPFKAAPEDGTLKTALKTAGNLPTSTVNAGTGALNFLNPVKNVVDIAKHVGETYQQIQNYSKETGENPLSILGKALTSGGDKPGQMPDIYKNALKAVTPQFLQDIFSGNFEAATKHIVEQPVENIAPLVLVASGLAEKAGAGEQFNNAISKVASPVTKGIPKIVDTVTPKGVPAADQFKEATGKIFQPKNAFETKTAQKVAANVDFSGLPKKPTYEQLKDFLENKVNEKISAVDAEYQKVGGSAKLKNLPSTKTALSDLKELYTKTRSKADVSRISGLIKKANTEGLTPVEINNIAKEYGKGFKAFSDKTGQPLTSVNSKAYENTRTAVKDEARSFLKDESAVAMDKNASSLIKVKDMADRMATKVEQLSNRIMKRSLGEKIGRALGIVGDWATLGSVKGFVAKLFPSNVGLKTMNSLDLESALGKNLKTIEKLTNASDSVILETLKKYAKKVNDLPNKMPAISTSRESQQ